MHDSNTSNFIVNLFCLADLGIRLDGVNTENILG